MKTKLTRQVHQALAPTYPPSFGEPEATAEADFLAASTLLLELSFESESDSDRTGESRAASRLGFGEEAAEVDGDDVATVGVGDCFAMISLGPEEAGAGEAGAGEAGAEVFPAKKSFSLKPEEEELLAAGDAA